MDAIFNFFWGLINHYGLAAMFVMMIVENLGFPMPTEIAFIVGQSMVVSGTVGYVEFFTIVLIGKTIGSIITYFLGKYFAGRIKHLDNQNGLKKSQRVFELWMKKYGSFAVFLSRVIGYVRPWSSYLAGIGEIKFVPFIFYNILGSGVIIAVTMLFFGYLFSLWQSYDFLRPLVFAMILISSVGFWVWFAILDRIRRKAKK